jgi:hypothetical protein
MTDFHESTVSQLLQEVAESGDSFVVIRHRGRTDELHEFLDEALKESDLFQNVVIIQSVIVEGR